MLPKCLGFFGSKNTSSSKKHYPTITEEQCREFLLQDLKKSTKNFDEKLVMRRHRDAWYRGCIKHNGVTDYAISLQAIRNHSNSEEKFKKEIALLCQLRHPNIVSLIGFCNHKKEKILVYDDDLLNGSLEDYLYSNDMDMEPLSWKKRLEICVGVARGLHYLHAGLKRSVFHCDVKPPNIRLDKNMVPKISSFDVSIQGALSTSKPKPIVDEVRGTIGYISPESFTSGVFSDKCDVYAFGKILLEMVCIKDGQMIINRANLLENQHWGQIGSEFLEDLIPLLGKFALLQNIVIFLERFPIEEIIDPILKGKIAPECLEVVLDITERCLKYEPDERPTMVEVEVLLEHALSMQEEADNRKTDGDYILLSATYVNRQPTISIDVNDIQELLCHQFSLADLRQTTSNFLRKNGLVKLNGSTCPIPIAVKKIDWSSICGSGKQWNFKKEIEKICLLRHPNLVSLLGFCDDHDEKILVYMYISNDLYNSLSLTKEPLAWKKRLEICIGVSQGLDYLHKATIFHRTMKLKNILLNDDLVPKLINFGLPWSKPIDADGYDAPEWSQGHDFTDKCDVYSFGLVLLRMIFKDCRSIKKSIYPTLKGKIAPQCWEVFQDITVRCLKFEANERPTMNEVKTQLQHALALQEEANANTTGDYKSLSITFDDRIKEAFAKIK